MEGSFCEFKEKWKSAILNADFSARTAPFVPFVFYINSTKVFLMIKWKNLTFSSVEVNQSPFPQYMALPSSVAKVRFKF